MEKVNKIFRSGASRLDGTDENSRRYLRISSIGIRFGADEPFINGDRYGNPMGIA